MAAIFQADFSEWRHYLPFYRQGDVDDAIELFKANIANAAGDKLLEARSKAWLSYCYAVVALEGWEIGTWGDGEVTDDSLIDVAYAMAEEATGLTSPPDFDALWAWAFAKMAKEEADASDVARMAIFRARAQAEDDMANGLEDSYAANSLSSLLAEAADIMIYQGHIDSALAAIYEALYSDCRAGAHSPDWYQWIHALGVFNQALLLEDQAAGQAALLYRRVLRILEKGFSRSESNHRYEFDSLRVRAAAHLKLGDEQGMADQLEKFHAKLSNRKPAWNAEKEKMRSKYLSTGAAGILKAKWSELADQLFPGTDGAG